MTRIVRCLLLLALAALLPACMHMPAETYQPGIDNTELLLRQGGAKLSVGTFDAAAGVENKRLGVRGSSLKGGGSEGTFAAYLREALIAELKTAGRFDDGAHTRIGGTLTRNTLDGGAIKIGTAEVGARFLVDRDGARAYDKSLDVKHQWESSFIGAIAIPAAMDNYVTAVQKLLHALFADPAFQDAAKPAAP